MVLVVLKIEKDKQGTENQWETAKAMLSVALRVIPGGEGFDKVGSRIPPRVSGTSAITTRSSIYERDDGVSASGSRKKRKTVAVSHDTSLLCHLIKRLRDVMNCRQAETGEGSLAAFVEN